MDRPTRKSSRQTGKASEVLPDVRAFISYSHVDRKYGAQAKSVLAEVGIEAFLAHEDLKVSEAWRERILDELRRCDLFVPLLSKSFLASEWAPQESGFMASRPNVVIAPLSIDGTTPFGFMSSVQSRFITDGTITRELLVEPLVTRMPRKILPALIRIAGAAKSFRDAEAKMRPLWGHYPSFAKEDAQALADAAVSNVQIWDAALCRTVYLPELIRVHGRNISRKTLRALKYQPENGRWYRGDDGRPDD